MDPNEMNTLLQDIRAGWDAVRPLPDEVAGLREHNAKIAKDVSDLRRMLASRSLNPAARQPKTVSTETARALGAVLVLHVEKNGRLDALASSPAARDALAGQARDILGITGRAPLTTGDIALPQEYSGEIRELIADFGICRKAMTMFPIGKGTARPVRMGTRPAFGSVAMSGAIGEKSPSVEFASLESHKIGGIVRVPREIDEQSIVAMGQFLARYGAIEFARTEDTWGFLADGSGTYEGVKGISQVALDNTGMVTLTATNTRPSNVTLADLRAVRRQVSVAALNAKMSAYYMDASWETQLPTFNTAGDPYAYQRLPDGRALLDGYPIVWTPVLQSFTTAATASKVVAVFGALSYWWMGEHLSPRMDTSDQVYFVNDQIGVRFIEEIDFDYIALNATAALRTAAA
jgi:HK97 family phage major capsid protein